MDFSVNYKSYEDHHNVITIYAAISRSPFDDGHLKVCDPVSLQIHENRNTNKIWMCQSQFF